MLRFILFKPSEILHTLCRSRIILVVFTQIYASFYFNLPHIHWVSIRHMQGMIYDICMGQPLFSRTYLPPGDMRISLLYICYLKNGSNASELRQIVLWVTRTFLEPFLSSSIHMLLHSVAQSPTQAVCWPFTLPPFSAATALVPLETRKELMISTNHTPIQYIFSEHLLHDVLGSFGIPWS